MEFPPKIQQELNRVLEELGIQDEELRKKIIEEVKRRYENSLVDVGEPVGIVAAQSLTEPATQMILRSFHFVGMAELQISLSLPRFIEICDGRKKIKEPYMIIHLKPEYANDPEVAMRVARKIREVTLGDIMKEMQVDIFNKKIKIILNKKVLEKLNLTVEEIVHTLKKKLKKVEIEEYTEDYILLDYKDKDKPIKEFYMYKDKLKDLQIAGIKGIKDVLVKKEGDEYVIYTYGSNLEEVMKIPEVDYTRVYSNNIHEVAKVLGIEAAREVIVREIMKILETQGLDVDIRHVLLLADVLTWYGEYLGVTRYGLNAEKSSALARAAFETPVKHFIKAAILGEKDELKTAIECVMTNQPIPYGTGLFKVAFKDEGFKKEET